MDIVENTIKHKIQVLYFYNIKATKAYTFTCFGNLYWIMLICYIARC